MMIIRWHLQLPGIAHAPTCSDHYGRVPISYYVYIKYRPSRRYAVSVTCTRCARQIHRAVSTASVPGLWHTLGYPTSVGKLRRFDGWDEFEMRIWKFFFAILQPVRNFRNVYRCLAEICRYTENNESYSTTSPRPCNLSASRTNIDKDEVN